MKKVNIKIPIFSDFNLTIIIGKDIKNITEKIYKDKIDYSFNGMFIDIGANLYIILKEEDVDSGLVAHECFHCVNHILDYVGIKLSKETDEVYAYLLQYVINEVYKVHNKK